mgnify:CR=1 FL=1
MEHDVIVLYIIEGVSFFFALCNGIFLLQNPIASETGTTLVFAMTEITENKRKRERR